MNSKQLYWAFGILVGGIAGVFIGSEVDMVRITAMVALTIIVALGYVLAGED